MDTIHINSYPSNIMIVDDTADNLRVLFDMLKSRGYSPRPVPNGKLALQAMKIERPDLILLDITMPELDGFEVCRRIKSDEKLKDIPIIFISALIEPFDKVKAFSLGGVDYITKPFHIDEVFARIETQLKVGRLQRELKATIESLEIRVREQVKEISDSQLATIFSLAKLAESRDDETGKHLERVRNYCKLLAEYLGEHTEYASQITTTFVDNIYQASPLHDIGKVGIPDAILLKPSKLTAEEFEIMKGHPVLGAQTLKAVVNQYPNNPLINMGIEITRSHHEWWDGSGYPDRLAGKVIPLSARIMSVADAFDAMRSKRVYKPSFSLDETRELIRMGSGTHHDPLVVKAFLTLQEKFNETFEELNEEAEKG